MKKVYLGLGSDLGNRAGNIKKAIDAVAASAGKILTASPMYETEPVGFRGNGDFVNMVIAVSTRLTPTEFLSEILQIESELGRLRGEERFISRIIDIDILLWDDEIINDSSLIIPHPRMHERSFVLVPLNDIAPDFIHPVLGRKISELLSECNDKCRIKPYKPPV